MSLAQKVVLKFLKLEFVEEGLKNDGNHHDSHGNAPA